jgi:hypothetical protein
MSGLSRRDPARSGSRQGRSPRALDATQTFLGRGARDPLTGFAPRDALEAVVRRLARTRPHRGDAPAGEDPSAPGIAGVLFDVIGLKNANACGGFSAGDALLRRAAARVRNLAPDARLLARLGGDELVVVFTGPAAASRAAGVCAEASTDGALPLLRAGWLTVRRGESPAGFFDRLHAAARGAH